MKRVPLRRKTKLRVVGTSDTSETKREIQRLLREIVMLRDGTCLLRKIRHCADTTLQADHLITRANSATYADSRLVVCVCRSCHAWKSLSERGRIQYEAMVKPLLPPARLALWEAAERDLWRPTPTRAQDWRLHVLILQRELEQLQKSVKIAA